MHNFYQPGSMHSRNSLGYLLRRASKLGTARSEMAFKGLEISFTQWIVLVLVYRHMADTSTELSRDLGHNSGAMSRLINQLEERGLLARAPDTDDRRIVRLVTTEAGTALVTDLATRVMDVWNDILKDFDEAEILCLIELLDRLVTRLEETDRTDGKPR